MSRRDETLTAVDSILTSVRTQIQAAIQEARDRDTVQPAGHSSVPSSRRSSLSERFRASVAAASHSVSSTPTGSPSLSRTLAAANPSAQYIDPSPSHSARPSLDSVPELTTPTTREPSAPQDGDALPGYSRRPPADPSTNAGLPPRRPRRLESKSGKLSLALHERGQDRIVVVQEDPDRASTIEGTLGLVLREPETISHVRIRLKGIVRTLVFKAHASGRHPVSDEVCFLEDSVVLWQRTDSTGHAHTAPPPGNTTSANDYTATGKLAGSMAFPFRLTVPARLSHSPETGHAYEPGPIRPPPSFMLDASTTASASPINKQGTAAALTGFEGSCRYYLKVTLGRTGLLKLNERWIVPIVFVPRQLIPYSGSPLREIALAEANLPPSSLDDPEGWSERGKYVARTALRKSGNLFKSSAIRNGGWVRLEGRVPRPQKFVKAYGELLEFEVQLTCSDAASLARFSPATIAVSLLQRTLVTAQGLTNTHDKIVLHAERVVAIGGTAGRPVRGRDGVEAYEIIYSGALKMTPSLAASFRAPNLQVAYLLCITLYQPTMPNAAGVSVTPSTHLSSIAIPLEIVTTPSRQRPLADPTRTARTAAADTAATADAAPPPSIDAPAAAVLPPEYPATQPDLLRRGTEPAQAPAAVSATASGSPKPVSSTSSRPVPAPPPSSALSTAAGPSSSTATATSAGNGLASPAIDSAEETRLEEMYGLPPSYFDVVEGSSNGQRSRR